jgi:hypothetical protein
MMVVSMLSVGPFVIKVLHPSCKVPPGVILEPFDSGTRCILDDVLTMSLDSERCQTVQPHP